MLFLIRLWTWCSGCLWCFHHVGPFKSGRTSSLKTQIHEILCFHMAQYTPLDHSTILRACTSKIERAQDVTKRKLTVEGHHRTTGWRRRQALPDLVRKRKIIKNRDPILRKTERSSNFVDSTLWSRRRPSRIVHPFVVPILHWRGKASRIVDLSHCACKSIAGSFANFLLTKRIVLELLD